jgi:hypothetical protein
MASFNRRTLFSYAVLLGLLFALLALLPPLDYRFFAAATRAWRTSQSSLYDAQAPQFFYAPWSLALLAPLSFLPDRFGQAIFNTISLLLLHWSMGVFAPQLSFRARLLALVSPYTAAVIVLGQWDALIVGGTALAWWAISRRRPWVLGAAFLIITTKPTNAVVIVVALLVALRGWPWQLWRRSLVFPLLALAGSLLACGWNWPVRYLAYLRTTPPLGYNVSLWRPEISWIWAAVVSVGTLGWLAWMLARHGVDGPRLALILSANLLVSPFVVPYHLVSTAPALGVLAHHNIWLGIVLWAVGTLAFLAFVLGWSLLPMTGYLLAILVGASFIFRRSAEEVSQTV